MREEIEGTEGEEREGRREGEGDGEIDRSGPGGGSFHAPYVVHLVAASDKSCH